MNWWVIISNIVFLYIILLFITPRGYYWYMPSWVPVYPKNEDEIPIVVRARNTITPELIAFHKRTDPSVIFAFSDFLQERGIEYPLKKLQDHIISWNVVLPVYFLKWIHNRKRVYQYMPGINLTSHTAATPAYPAGHAYQAYTLAKILSKEYPQYRSEFIKLAEKCDYVRVAAGLHYPSDGEYSRWLVGTI
jgi:hypothetical protein